MQTPAPITIFAPKVGNVAVPKLKGFMLPHMQMTQPPSSQAHPMKSTVTPMGKPHKPDRKIMTINGKCGLPALLQLVHHYKQIRLMFVTCTKFLFHLNLYNVIPLSPLLIQTTPHSLVTMIGILCSLRLLNCFFLVYIC